MQGGYCIRCGFDILEGTDLAVEKIFELSQPDTNEDDAPIVDPFGDDFGDSSF